jgi:4-hydroxy-3-polyprenylbenzoate decarboxylase
MAYRSLSHFISTLESACELIRVKEPVSPRLEITEIADRMIKSRGKALLFENTGTGFPLLINAFGSRSRMSLALGVGDLDEIGVRMEKMFRRLLGPRNTLADKLRMLPLVKEAASFMPKRKSGKGRCQEMVMETPDLSKLPVLTCWPEDGGPFITLPVVHTRDPLNGTRNVGMYRMQVFGPMETGMHWHLHKGSAQHYSRYREMGKKMPVTVILGGDPVYTYVATAPVPEGLDEYLLAGFLRKKKVELVRCLTNDLEVPDDADFVIEGYVDPDEEMVMEGPFGDHTGFYSLADRYPRFHVTCITHRKDAVYPATIVGIPPMEDEWLGNATERIFLVPIRATVVPEMKDMNMPAEGVFHNIVLASIKKTFSGQGMKVMNSLWGAGQMMFNKVLIITGEQTDVHNCREVARKITETVDPLQDIQFIRGPVDILDHSSRKFALGSKMGIDATEKMAGEPSEKVKEAEEFFVDPKALRERFPEISAVNDTLYRDGISILVLAFRKSRPGHAREIFGEAMKTGLMKGIKFIIATDPEVDVADPGMVAWICANNIDPAKDCFFTENEHGNPYPALFVDGTRKSMTLDGFRRDWPNIIVMDDATIKRVDENWENYQLGPFIPSPSRKYKPLVLTGGAVACQEG